MTQRKADWTLPTTYADGSAIPAEVLAKILTHIYRDGVEVAVSAPGATSVSFDVTEVQGQAYVYTGKSEVDGVVDDLSVASEATTFIVPFLVLSPPTGLSIT